MANPEGNYNSAHPTPETQKAPEKSRLSPVNESELSTRENSKKAAVERSDQARAQGEAMVEAADPKAKAKLKGLSSEQASKDISKKLGEKLGETAGKAARKGVEATLPGVAGKAAGFATEFAAKKAGELLGEMGLAETVAENLPSFAGSEHVSQAGSDLLTSVGAKGTAKGALKGAGMAAEKLGMKVGMEAFSKTLAEQVKRKVIVKLERFAGREMLDKIFKKAVGKAGVAAATFASPIPLLDDLIGLGMVGLMAKDAYDVAVLTKKAININQAIKGLSDKEIADIDFVDKNGQKDERSEKAFEAAVVASGKTLEEMTPEDKMNLIYSIADINVKITRAGSTGYEIYRFVKGEVFSVSIKKEDGEVLELSDDELNKDVALGPPEEFKKIEIDYTKKESIPAQLRLGFLRLKNEMGWTKLDGEVLDEKTILLKRLDGGKESTTLTREGNKWSIKEAYTGGLDIDQAIMMGNFLNKVKDVIKTNGEVGGSDRPFYEDHSAIMFDRSYNIWNNLDILSSGNWQKFFGTKEIGIDKYKLMDMLNNWYQREYGKR